MLITMKQRRKYRDFLVLVFTAFFASLLSVSAQAYEKGDVLVRFGAGTVQPKENSSNIRGILGVLPGTDVKVDNDTQPAITVEYLFTENLGLELLAATPFSHAITADGLEALGIYHVGKTDHLPPTLSLHYYLPGLENSSVRPYLGAGYNYTLFTGDTLSTDVTNTLATLGLPATDLKLNNSHGGSLQFGVDIDINDDWFVNASFWRMDIDTQAGIYVGPHRILEVDVDLDPMVGMIGIGRAF